MQIDSIIERAEFMADDGVQFSGAIDAAGHVVIDMDDPDGEVDNRVQLLADDLGNLVAMLERFQRASRGDTVASHGSTNDALQASA